MTRQERAERARFTFAVDAFLSGFLDDAPVAEEFGMPEDAAQSVVNEMTVAHMADLAWTA